MQRTWGKQGWALHWGRKGPGGSEDGGVAGPPRERRLRAYWACTCKVQGKGHQLALGGWGVPCGAEATVPGVTHGLALMWEGARPGGEQGVPEGICSWDPVGWVLMGGGRHFEGGCPQRRREVVVGACVPGGEEAVGAEATRW